MTDYIENIQVNGNTYAIRDANALTKEEAQQLDTNPVGAIVPMAYYESSKYYPCDGSEMSLNIYNSDFTKYNYSNCYTWFYRLCNKSRNNAYWNNLWTDDKQICDRKNPDLSRLYRQIENSVVGAYPALCPVAENITMTFGKITSESGFYDGEYEVHGGIARIMVGSYPQERFQTVNVIENPARSTVEDIKFDVHNEKRYAYINRKDVDVDYKYTLKTYSSAAVTDRKISDNFYLTNVTDGKEVAFYTTDTDDTGKTTNTFTPIKTNILDNLHLSFEFITPHTLVENRDIFFSYRALVFRMGAIAENKSKLLLYMSSYKRVANKKTTYPFRHSGVDTGITLEPDKKYKLDFIMESNTGDDADTAPNKYTLNISEWEETKELDKGWINTQTYTFTSKYFPYNEANNYGLGHVYCVDNPAWVSGLCVDLYSLKIQYNQSRSDGEVITRDCLTFSKHSTFACYKDDVFIPEIPGYYIKIKK